MRVAIVADSNSGITQEQAGKLGMYVLPMPFMIDGKEYLEGISLTHAEFYDMQVNNHDISTSQPSPESVTGLWDKILEEYDQIVHIPMSSGLSSSCATATMLAEDYDGKVVVVNNQRISDTQRLSAIDAVALAKQGLDAHQIGEILDRTKFDATIYIMLDTLKYLKKGGRITPAAAALGTFLRLKPVLTIQGDKLDAFSKARTIKQAKATMIAAVAHDMEERFGDKTGAKCRLAVLHTQNEEAAQEFAAELKVHFPEAGEIPIDQLPLSICTHIGPGSLAVTATKKMEELES